MSTGAGCDLERPTWRGLVAVVFLALLGVLLVAAPAAGQSRPRGERIRL